MGCKVVSLGKEVFLVSCSRPTPDTCAAPGCKGRPSSTCAHPVRRREPGASATCDRKLCVGCAGRVGGVVVCPPHRRLLAKGRAA